MVPPRLARCPLPSRDQYDAREINARADCLGADRDTKAAHVVGLQRAIRVREAIVNEALAASKK